MTEPVTLDVYEWHKLLAILERTVCTVNSPNRVYARCLYEKIGSQLSEFPVRVILEPKASKPTRAESWWRRFLRERRHVIY